MKLRKFIRLIILFVFVWESGVIFAKKVMTLPGLADPFVLAVSEGKVYVSDSKKVKVFIYSLKDLKLFKELLKKGIGPQECQLYPKVQITPDRLCVYTNWPKKAMFFSKDGVYQTEFRITMNGINSFYPVDKNYVAKQVHYTQSKPYGDKEEFVIYTYENKEIKYKKLFYCFDRKQVEYVGDKSKAYMIRDYADFVVSDNKVFLGDSKLGLYVLIFDSNGNQIGKIKIPYENIKITEQFKTYFMESAKKFDPLAYEMASKTQIFLFPEYFPSFFRFAVDRGKIYFLTYNFKGNQREVIISDLKGNVLKKAYVPLIYLGVEDTFAIDNDKFYYILENEDTEEYELHVADIK